MHLDQHGLPVQSDGDNRDQLQRCGMIATASALEGTVLDENIALALRTKLQARPGLYTRYVGGATDNVSADQLIPVIAYFIAARMNHDSILLCLRMISRLGFAQNYRDGLSLKTSPKIPDFMFFRAAPLFVRLTPLFYPLSLITDWYLLLMVSTVCLDRHPNHVDDNNLIVTLAVCRARLPTPLSALACKLYARLRPWNLGCD